MIFKHQKLISPCCRSRWNNRWNRKLTVAGADRTFEKSKSPHRMKDSFNMMRRAIKNVQVTQTPFKRVENARAGPIGALRPPLTCVRARVLAIRYGTNVKLSAVQVVLLLPHFFATPLAAAGRLPRDLQHSTCGLGCGCCKFRHSGQHYD